MSTAALQQFPIVKEAPSRSTHFRTDELAQFHAPDGESFICQKHVGNKKGASPVWVLIPQFELQSSGPPKKKSLLQKFKGLFS